MVRCKPTLKLNAQGPRAQTAQVQGFFARHYGAFDNNDTAINDNRFVPLPDNWKTAVTDTFGTASNAQGIGNTSVCNAIGRPL